MSLLTWRGETKRARYDVVQRQEHNTQGASSAPNSRPHYLADLTEREVEVLRLVAQGMTNAEIADILIISVRTVEAHLRSIFGKLQVTNRSAATRFALEHL